MKKTKVWLLGVPLAIVAIGALYVSAFGLSSLANPGPKLPGQTAEEADLKVVTFAEGLEQPWGMAFMPDGRALVTEKPGRLRIVDKRGRLSSPIAGLPDVVPDAQGGLLGVAIDPDFSKNRLVYLSFSEASKSNPDINSTAVVRGKLQGTLLSDAKVIWRQAPKMESNYHFGSRLVFGPDGNLYVTLGERYSGMKRSQDLDNTLGKIVRITTDGAAAAGNPFVGQDGVMDEIYSYGHRNIQGAAIHPTTGVLWAHEHGPRGGDELNIIRPGNNYGWPAITYGIDYSMAKISEFTEKPGMEQPIHYWVPSIAPSGMTFYTGDVYEGWKGSLLVGSLVHMRLVRLELDGETVTKEVQLLSDLEERIRDVVQGPDGYVYLLADSEEGRVLRLEPR